MKLYKVTTRLPDPPRVYLLWATDQETAKNIIFTWLTDELPYTDVGLLRLLDSMYSEKSRLNWLVPSVFFLSFCLVLSCFILSF